MKPNKDNIEDFTKFIMNEAGTKTPSVNFVDAVMGKVSLENKPVIETVYKPVISKRSWFIIAIMTVAFCVYLILGNPSSSSLDTIIDLSFFNKLSEITFFESIQIPNLFSISFIFFTVLVLFQLVAIKNYFNSTIKHNYS